MDVAIEALAPERVDDFLRFFDEVAFADNPGWAGCYCVYNHLDCSDEEFAKRAGAENRELARRLVLDGRMAGYLAYADGRVAAWCNVNEKPRLPRLRVQPEPPAPPTRWGERIWSIACFVVDHRLRRQGLARRLLARACADLAPQAPGFLEAYVRKGEGLTAALQYHGPLSLYLAAGFEPVAESERFRIVRRRL